MEKTLKGQQDKADSRESGTWDFHHQPLHLFNWKWTRYCSRPFVWATIFKGVGNFYIIVSWSFLNQILLISPEFSAFKGRQGRSFYMRNSETWVVLLLTLLQHPPPSCLWRWWEGRFLQKQPIREQLMDQSAFLRPTQKAGSSSWRTARRGVSGRWVAMLNNT